VGGCLNAKVVPERLVLGLHTAQLADESWPSDIATPGRAITECDGADIGRRPRQLLACGVAGCPQGRLQGHLRV